MSAAARVSAHITMIIAAMTHSVMPSLKAVLFQALFNCYLFSSCCSPAILAAVIQDSRPANRTTKTIKDMEWRSNLHQYNMTDRVYQHNWLNTTRTMALEQNRHFIGNSPPATSTADGITAILNRQKRQAFHPGTARPACPYTTAWKVLHSARNMDGQVVEVVQPVAQPGFTGFQYFHTQTCHFDRMRRDHSARKIACPTCCLGVDSHRHGSKCEQRLSFVNAFVRGAPTYEPHWEFIHVNTGCMCVVS